MLNKNPTVIELQSYISFQLSELNSKNKHHLFEDMCRHFARIRLCENILPATGPVSAGGDQGRDFETYKTYLSTTPIVNSLFLECVKENPIVFACSLNKQIVTKIKSDLATIFKNAPQLEHVYYFSNQGIPVAKRHDLEHFCKNNHQTDLTIIDRQALSEALSTVEVFWIAQEYLGVASDMFPKPKESSSVYDNYKKMWLDDSSLTPQTHADFQQIQFGLREARYNRNDLSDLPNWIKKMACFLSDNFSAEINRKATYEIAAAALRGLNNLSPQIERIKKYFSNIEDLKNTHELEDAVCLLSYCSKAHSLKHCEFDETLLNSWHSALTLQIERLLKENTKLGTPAYRAYLLMLRGQIELMFLGCLTNGDKEPKKLLKWWGKTIIEAKQAPFFPLERFSSVINLFIPLLGRSEAFIKLTKRVDELLGKRSSMKAVAENCRDRAMTYYEAENYLQAIRELQESKVNWFTSETLCGSLLAMLTIADCYRKLKLIPAAKYYAASTAQIAFDSNNNQIKDILSMALFLLSECFFEGGEWLYFMQSAQLALIAHNNYAENPLDPSKHEDLGVALSYFVKIKTLSERFFPEIAKQIEKQYSNWPIDSELREGINQLAKEDENIWWRTETKETIWRMMQNDLSARPFCELGKTRKITWNSLGIKWRIHFQNTYDRCVLAEYLAAIIQIILADIANIDLCLLPTIVDIDFDLNDSNKINIEDKPDNFATSLRVTLPKTHMEHISHPDKTATERESEVVALALHILCKCSMLPDDRCNTLLAKKIKNGLLNKVFNGMPHLECYQSIIIPREQAEEINASNYEPLNSGLEFQSIEVVSLRWNDRHGYGYSTSLAKKFLKNRYTKAIRPIRLTLKIAIKDTTFKAFLNELKNEGYLDWQILLIILNEVVNYRTRERAVTNIQDQIAFQKVIMNREELESDTKIPIDTLLHNLRSQKNMKFITTFGAIAQTWKLVIKQVTPDVIAIKKLLDAKYGNSTDDIQHKEFLLDNSV
ncbi:MAG: hypothetical protein KAS93_02490 [Gammaproteobacteria bacterium]|nr:hypothetical protein [Gammaproteobacteria bacterium]